MHFSTSNKSKILIFYFAHITQLYMSVQLYVSNLVTIAYLECLRPVVSCLNVSLNYLKPICIFLPLKLVQQCYTICVNLWSVRYVFRHFVLLALWVFVMSVNFGFDILHQLKTLLIVHCCICCFYSKKKPKKSRAVRTFFEILFIAQIQVGQQYSSLTT